MSDARSPIRHHLELTQYHRLWQDFLMDVSFAVFYIGYAFVFNWVYDRLFWLPEWQKLEAA
jgi:uncharacterized membrane protein